MPDYDALVLGLGGVGSAACLELRRRGHRVLGVERFGRAHSRGSSHGQTRVIRRAYFEHPDYVPALNEAYAGFARLERETGRSLFVRAGVLLAGSPEGVVVSGSRRAAREHGIPIRELSAAEAAREFSDYRFDTGWECVLEPDAGYLMVEACVSAQLELAERAGAELWFDTPLKSWRAEAGTFVAETARGPVTSERLVVCAGAWTTQLLDALALPLSVQRKMQIWLPARAAAGAERPVFGFQTMQSFFYGFPAIGGLVKTAEHFGGSTIVDPDALARECSEQDSLRVRQFASRYLPCVEPRVASHAACMYTMTPDEHFIVDRHPKHPQLVFAAGLSGHGFKFVPYLGQALARLAMDATAPAPELFALARFARQGTGRTSSEPNTST